LYKNKNKAAIGYKAGCKSVLVAGFSLFALSDPAMSSNHSSAQSFSQADPFSIEIGAYYWFQRYSGDVKIFASDPEPAEVRENLGILNDTKLSSFIDFRHGITYLPWLKLQQTNINSNTYTHIEKTFYFGGFAFEFDRDIYAEMDFDHRDVDIYYPVWVDGQTEQVLGVGLTVREFDGRTFVRTTDDDIGKCSSLGIGDGCPFSYELVFDDKVPLLYIQGETQTMISGLSLKALLQYGNYKQNKMSDLDLSVKYEFNFGLTVFGGLRHAILDLGDFAGIEADITASGLYFGAGYQF
jgi:outer membrane protein